MNSAMKFLHINIQMLWCSHQLDRIQKWVLLGERRNYHLSSWCISKTITSPSAVAENAHLLYPHEKVLSLETFVYLIGQKISVFLFSLFFINIKGELSHVCGTSVIFSFVSYLSYLSFCYWDNMSFWLHYRNFIFVAIKLSTMCVVKMPPDSSVSTGFGL